MHINNVRHYTTLGNYIDHMFTPKVTTTCIYNSQQLLNKTLPSSQTVNTPYIATPSLILHTPGLPAMYIKWHCEGTLFSCYMYMYAEKAVKLTAAHRQCKHSRLYSNTTLCYTCTCTCTYIVYESVGHYRRSMDTTLTPHWHHMYGFTPPPLHGSCTDWQARCSELSHMYLLRFATLKVSTSYCQAQLYCT